MILFHYLFYMKNIFKVLLLTVVLFWYNSTFANSSINLQVEIIFERLESKYMSESIWAKNQQYKKIIQLLEQYKSRNSNKTLNELIDGVNKKLEDTIYTYENKVDTGSCSETYNWSTLSNGNWKCVCAIWYNWAESDDGTMWCADYNLWSCIQELGFLSIYDSNTNSCWCQEGYFIGTKYGWDYCVSNSEHPMITQQGVFAPKLYFGWYACTQDCSGHIAGYEWAKEKSIYNSLQCGGNSQSFIEWCYVYTETY